MAKGANERHAPAANARSHVFGQIPGGFAQVEAPAILCKVIPNVLAPSFVNAADVGGLYNGQWIQGVSRRTTAVYRKPVKLPRTGYCFL